SLVAKHGFEVESWALRPISANLAPLFFDTHETASTWYEVFWWMHVLVVFGFMNFLPYSKHLHVFTSIPNVYFEKLGKKKFEIKPINLEDES
ncbi:MAG: Fe-S oxidoreductase, partial [Ignavibacteriae bacterium]|nr:Fe-S oxidoreductase [Ignavibacteriota bacterium]